MAWRGLEVGSVMLLLCMFCMFFDSFRGVSLVDMGFEKRFVDL